MKGLGKEKREVFLVQLGLSWPGKNGSEGCDRVSGGSQDWIEIPTRTENHELNTRQRVLKFLIKFE
jgi:hypothetical protein